MLVNPGTTSQSIDIQILNDSGLPVTGLVAATMPPIYYSLAGPNSAVQITLSDLSLITSAYSSGGVKERSGSAGVYRLDLPNGALTTAGTVKVYGEASGKHLVCEPIEVQIISAFNSASDTVVLAAQTHAGAVIPTVSTLTGHTPQTGDAFARIGNNGANLTALGDTRIANLDAAVSSRSTYAGADTPGTTTLLSRLTASRAGYLDNLNGLVAAIWSAVVDSSGVTTLLSRLTSGRATSLDNLDVAVSTRNATTPPTVAAIRAEIDSNSTKLDVAVSTRSNHSAADVWSVPTRTLSSFGTLVNDMRDAVWGATSRTLTAFGFTVSTNVNATETAIKTVTDKLDSMIEADGADFRFDANALELAPTGGGGGGVSDWTSDEKAHIRHRLGIDGTAVAPTATPSLALKSTQDTTKTVVDATKIVADAVKAKTDNLPVDPASNTHVNTRLAASAYTNAPTTANIVDALKADAEWKTILANVNGVFDYNPTTRVLTLKNKAGTTTLATLTLTQNVDGVVTNRASS